MNALFLLVASLVAVNCAPFAQKNPMINEGEEFFGGDMLGVKLNELKGVAQIISSGWKRWPNGVLPYEIQAGVFTSSQLSVITSAMRQIESQVGASCIRFVPRTTESTYLRIEGTNQGCYSYVGMQQRAGPQVVSLSTSGCVYKGTAIHELLHAVGFHHEQNRPDRDSYIKVNYENISPAMAYNFDKFTNVDTQGFPYDYYSIMQYESNAFSMNGRETMVPLQAGVTLKPTYYKYAMTSIDVEEVRKWYGCSA